ncbi:CTC-interacting domain 7 [Hibiscus trionum]|uniref:CTC-interacting domain 7 n=1 Tax=Hibiscus trionum TaxID=183268 RepID=A0A9W7MBV1_HIBTR|nr:CTC-interacting domain 7 [Hibiscus trionum]
MSLSKKGTQINDTKLNAPRKVTTLNPNAAEFVPFSLRSPSSSGSSSVADTTVRFATSGTIKKVVLDRSESSVTNNSDEEAHLFWRCQLPDDITPDFKVLNEDDSQGIRSGSLSVAGISSHDGSEASRFPATAGSEFVFGNEQELLHHYGNSNGNGNNFTENSTYPASFYGEDPTLASPLHLSAKPWNKQLVDNEQILGNGMEGQPYNGNSRHGFINDMLSGPTVTDDTEKIHVGFLASQFPGFAAESLTEIYYASGCDLNLTIEMLTQLELQDAGGFNQNLNSKTLSAPNLSTLDFAALTMSDGQSGTPKHAGDDLQHRANLYRSYDKENMLMFKTSSSLPSKATIDFALAGRKMASQGSGIWKYDSVDSTVGPSRSSHGSANSYSSSPGRGVYASRLHARASAPVWLETGDAMANMYTELREEAQDNARLRNAYLEQAHQAFLIGNKALAKELGVKGQLPNMHMKAAHGRVQEPVFRQRNPVPPENIRGQERMIDLHGFHIPEAIQLLKHELSMLRRTAGAADQRLQVYIYVGTGHHTKGSRTPARLPVAVQRYLLEEEFLDYSEPRPGLLRVVIY